MDEPKETSAPLLTPTEVDPTEVPLEAPVVPAKRPSPNPRGLIIFSKIKEARKALLAEAEAIRDLYMTNLKDAMAEGQHDVAQEGLQWLMEHMPADEDGIRIIDQGIDKPKAEAKGGSGPIINIGVQLGGLKREALPPAPPIEAETVEVDDVDD